MPMPSVADPHTTGNSIPSSISWASVRSSSFVDGTSPAR